MASLDRKVSAWIGIVNADAECHRASRIVYSNRTVNVHRSIAVKATRQFHNRLQDALVIIHSVVKKCPIGATVDETDIRVKLTLARHHLEAALMALFRRSPPKT